jgi:CRP-like cAMP-binding protein
MIDIKNLKVSKGDYIYKEGDPSDKIYFIKNGDFEISKKMKVEDV